MAVVNQPPILASSFAVNGDKNTIPATNSGTEGLASLSLGFPSITSQPVSQGGIPPQREDFNGIFNLITNFLMFLQNGSVFAYSSTLDYQPPAIVYGNNALYRCVATNGANTSAGVQPLSNTTYWKPLIPVGAIKISGNVITITNETGTQIQYTIDTINNPPAQSDSSNKIVTSAWVKAYAPSKSGSGASGTWKIDVSGNANTAGNITQGYSSSSANFPIDTFRKTILNIGQYGFGIRPFNCKSPDGANASYSGIGFGANDTHGFLQVSYASSGVNKPRAIVGGGNSNKINWYKDLVFTDGTGATGTWGINISGNAKVLSETHITGNTTGGNLPFGTTWSTINNNNFPCNYGNCLSIKGSGAIQIAVEWVGSDATAGRMFFRNARDVSLNSWSPWREIAYTTGNIASADNAKKATQDSQGQQINTTYVKSVTGSNATITITKGNGTTSSVTVNNVSHATSADNAKKATQDSQGQQINTTYVKSVTGSNATLTITKGNGATSSVTVNNVSHATSADSSTNTGNFNQGFQTNDENFPTSTFRQTILGRSGSGICARPFCGKLPTNIGISCPGMAFGGIDTHGFIQVDYGSPNVYVGGGNANKISWYKKLAITDSPGFSGTPTAPTPATSDNSTRIATTAFVKSLFTKCERKAPKFIYGDISSLKNNDSISLFFIVLYF